MLQMFDVFFFCLCDLNVTLKELIVEEKPKVPKKASESGPRTLTEPQTPKLRTQLRTRAPPPEEVPPSDSHKRKRRAMDHPRIGEGLENVRMDHPTKKPKTSYTLNVTDPQPFTLSTQLRSSSRQAFEDTQLKRALMKEEQNQQLRQEKEKAERREIKKMRSEEM